MNPLDHEIIFYDGTCGFCHRWVRFVLAQDKRSNSFLFSPRQSSFYVEHVPEELANAETIVVRDSSGNFLGHSTAVAYILKQLGGKWKICGQALEWIPRIIRDTGYKCVSRVRKKIMPAPDDVCPVVPEIYRERFMRD